MKYGDNKLQGAVPSSRITAESRQSSELMSKSSLQLVFSVLNFSCCATNERKHGMKSVPELVMLQGGVCALCTAAAQPAR